MEGWWKGDVAGGGEEREGEEEEEDEDEEGGASWSKTKEQLWRKRDEEIRNGAKLVEAYDNVWVGKGNDEKAN